MRLFLIATLLLSAPLHGAQAQLESCKVLKVVDDNVFEEGLSTHEYPDIDVTRTTKGLEVSVGAMRDWEQANGDYVRSSKKEDGSIWYNFRYKGSRESFAFVVQPAKRRTGKLFVNEDGKLRLVAVAYCK